MLSLSNPNHPQKFINVITRVTNHSTKYDQDIINVQWAHNFISCCFIWRHCFTNLYIEKQPGHWQIFSTSWYHCCLRITKPNSILLVSNVFVYLVVTIFDLCNVSTEKNRGSAKNVWGVETSQMTYVPPGLARFWTSWGSSSNTSVQNLAKATTKLHSDKGLLVQCSL